MQVQKELLEPTKAKLTIVATPAELAEVKQHVLRHLSANVKVAGFRPGKAPANLIEKQIDQAQLQAEFLDHAVNDLYAAAAKQTKFRPVEQPKIEVTKFVPFNTLEFTAEAAAVGDIQLGNYKSIKLASTKSAVSAKDVDDVISSLRQRSAAKEEVSRAAKNGDELVVDFTGTDAKTKDAIQGADGKDYPLLLGSNSFIPGFEEELIGLKAGGTKTFGLIFPKDYGAKELQGRKVNFEVTVRKVQALKEPRLDDALAATVGPFKTIAELKADIKKQLSAEKQREADQAYDNELLEKIAGQTEVAIPKSLIDEEIDRLEESEKRDIAYRGQTWQEHLDAEGVNAEQHHERQRPNAELRVKSGLILGAVADLENITATPEELEVRIMLLKSQYAADPAMQAELDKPEGRREINNRLLIEKTLDKLRAYAQSKPNN